MSRLPGSGRSRRLSPRRRLVALAVAVLVIALLIGALTAPRPGPGEGKTPVDEEEPTVQGPQLPPPPAATVRVVEAAQVAQLAGAGSRERTAERYGVHGTDLGHMFRHGGGLRMVFGDTFAARQQDWRSNTMAIIADPDPTNGLVITGMITDNEGHAAELLGSQKVDGVEMTVIPTYGTSIGGTMYLHYMSVRSWGAPGVWDANHAGIASSSDGGRTWTDHPEVRWPGNSGFVQVAFARHDRWQYAVGIPAGRFGQARLARVRPEQLLDLSAWRYWDGRDWVADHEEAVPIVPDPVGELSIRYSHTYDRWLMTYLDERQGAVVLRTAPELTGPWSSDVVVVTGREVPTLYAPYLVPAGPAGPDVYFTLSRYDSYSVSLWRATLDLDLPGRPVRDAV